MESLQLSQLWTVAVVLAGFQVAALTWRINREIYVEERGTTKPTRNRQPTGDEETNGNRKREPTWVTIADGFVFVSFMLLIFGVFAAPVFSAMTVECAARLLGLSLVIFGVSPVVLAGHYNLYCSWVRSIRVTELLGKNGWPLWLLQS